ncbi:MAG TPA: PEP-CTERM sorting domain-containing protein [Phytomonospora sp.]
MLRKLLVPFAVVASVAYAPPAHATVGIFFSFGAAAVSYVPVTALAGGAALTKSNTAAIIMGSGATAVTVADPLSAVFYTGSFDQYYEPTFVEILRSGWLGTWGADPSLPAPPADLSSLPDGPTPFYLQEPNAALTASIVNDAAAGVQHVAFDWGPNGHPETATGPFNFYASVFRAKRPLMIRRVGEAPNATPPAGANLYVAATGAGVRCIPAGDNVIRTCGEPTTSYYEISAVPEPATGWLLAAGLLATCAACRRVSVAGRGVTVC